MRPSGSTVFMLAAGAAVAAAIVAGLVIVGGPGEARRQRLDGERLQALEQISLAVDAYHRKRGALPPSLAALAAQEGEFPPVTLTDPATGAPYGYRAAGPDAFELCAVFDRPADEEVAVRWRHGPGRACFTLTAAPAAR